MRAQSFALLGLWILAACSSKKSFQGTDKTGVTPATPAPAAKEVPKPVQVGDSNLETPAPAPEPLPSPAVAPLPVPEPVPLPQCAANQVQKTLVKLLTTDPVPLPSSPVFRFEISLRNCKDGQLVPFVNQIVYFDIDAYRDEQGAPISYRTLDGAMKEMNKGEFSVVSENRDLFGNMIRGFVFFKTESFSLPKEQEKVIFEVSPGGLTQARVPTLGGFEIFLRVGDSEPAQQLIKVK